MKAYEAKDDGRVTRRQDDVVAVEEGLADLFRNGVEEEEQLHTARDAALRGHRDLVAEYLR